MRQKKLILALVLPLLTSGLLVSCKPKENDNNPQSLNPNAGETLAKLPENNQNLEELQKTLTEAETNLDNVETSLESLNSNLREFVNAKDEEKDEIIKSIDFEPTTESWDQFKQTWVTLKDQLDNESRVKLSLNKEVNFEANENDFVTELEQKITELDAIIKLLNEPIIKENKAIIEQLQKILETKLNNYGNFGLKTQGELQNKTTDKIKAIKDDINTVKEKINDLLNSSDVSNLKDPIEQLTQENTQQKQKQKNTELTQQNKTLETEKNVLTQQINDSNKKFIVTLAVLLGLMTLNISLIVMLVKSNYQRKYEKKNKQLKKLEITNSSDEQNTVLKSENDIKQLVEEITKLDKELDTLTQINKKQEITISQLSQGNSYLKNQNTSNTGSQPSYSHNHSSSTNILESIDYLLEIYHYRPEELSDYITRAVITQATLHGNREVAFEEDKEGNYWIIKRKDSDDLLLPKAKYRINENAYLTFQRIFNCQEHPSHRNGFLTVHQPGTLTFDINKQEWKLKEKGRITFDKISLEKKLENKIKETQEKFKQKNNEFNKLNRKSEQIQQDLKRKNDQLQSNLNKSEQEKQQLKSELKKLSQHINYLVTNLTKTNQQELVSIYNDNKLLKYDNRLIAVSTEPKSIETSRTDSGKRHILTEQNPSKYWIVEIGRDLYLVPKENALNTNDMTSVEVLFECQGYKKDVSNPKAFTLIKPGKVKEINGQWELVECGILEYR